MPLYIVLRLVLSTCFGSARTVLAGRGIPPPLPSRGRLLQGVWAVQSASLSSARLCVVAAGTCLGVLALIVVRECFQRKRLNRSYNLYVTCVRLQFAGIVGVVIERRVTQAWPSSWSSCLFARTTCHRLAHSMAWNWLGLLAMSQKVVFSNCCSQNSWFILEVLFVDERIRRCIILTRLIQR